MAAAENPFGVNNIKMAPGPGSPGTIVILRVCESTNSTADAGKSIGSFAFIGVHLAVVPTRKPEPLTSTTIAFLPETTSLLTSAPAGRVVGLFVASAMTTVVMAGGSAVIYRMLAPEAWV